MFLAFSSVRLRIQLPSRPPWWNACYTRYEAPVGATVPGFDGALGGFSTDSRKLRESGASKSSTGVCPLITEKAPRKWFLLKFTTCIREISRKCFLVQSRDAGCWTTSQSGLSRNEQSYPENGHCQYISMRTIHDKALDVFFLQYIRTNPTWFW